MINNKFTSVIKIVRRNSNGLYVTFVQEGDGTVLNIYFSTYAQTLVHENQEIVKGFFNDLEIEFEENNSDFNNIKFVSKNEPYVNNKTRVINAKNEKPSPSSHLLKLEKEKTHMTIKQIEKTWIENFNKSFLIKEGKFDKSISKALFHGDDNSEFDIDLLKEGFNNFYNDFHHHNAEQKLDSFIKYLHFIGITIKKKSIIDSVAKGQVSYSQIAKKAYFIFRTLSNYDESLDISNPFYDNMGDLFFFLRLEDEGGLSNAQLTIFEEIELPQFYNSIVQLPNGYEKNVFVLKLFNQIENSNKSFFLSGKAGTGKSTFIHYLSQKTKKKTLLFAYTGIAAMNIGGETLHSFFKFPIKPLMPNDPDIRIFREFYQKRKIIESLDTLIIDEISMLRADLLEGLDYSLRMNGGNKNELFGGKQIIFVGDPFQLPPIFDSSNEVEKELFSETYNSEYFFDSIAYKKLNPNNIQFDKIYRQNDTLFINLLNKVRDCSINREEIDLLNKNVNKNFVPDIQDFVITLTTNNFLARSENMEKLTKLPYKSHFYRANIIGDFKEEKYPTEPILELRRNAQVIFTRNDTSEYGKRWVNGTLGKIEFLDDSKIEVKLQNGNVYTIQKEVWENRLYQWDNGKKRITSKVIGTFEQYPIKLAWAITIHKSQGLTFDKVIVDLGAGAFVNGQLYTALSRCKTLHGLVLKNEISNKDIIQDKRLINFDRNLQYLDI